MLMLAIPVSPQVVYEQDYKLRLLSTWFALGGLTWAIEFSRAKAYRHMREFNARVEETSLLDPLTNVLNRRGFSERFEAEESRFYRTGENFSLLMIDLDNFKSINDTYGHLVGDETLVMLCNIMREHLRGMDVLGRWGGEEFVVILGRTDSRLAAEVAEKLRATIENFRGFPAQENRSLTVSIGVTDYQQHQSFDRMTKFADKAMYVAKTGGKNRVESL